MHFWSVTKQDLGLHQSLSGFSLGIVAHHQNMMPTSYEVYTVLDAESCAKWGNSRQGRPRSLYIFVGEPQEVRSQLCVSFGEGGMLVTSFEVRDPYDKSRSTEKLKSSFSFVASSHSWQPWQSPASSRFCQRIYIDLLQLVYCAHSITEFHSNINIFFRCKQCGRNCFDHVLGFTASVGSDSLRTISESLDRGNLTPKAIWNPRCHFIRIVRRKKL